MLGLPYLALPRKQVCPRLLSLDVMSASIVCFVFACKGLTLHRGNMAMATNAAY
jgi:hypothetical protein